MAATKITLNDTLVGQIVSPFPDGFITRMVLMQSQTPAWQPECWIDLPYPHGTWRSGRFILRDLSGAGKRLINVSTQVGCFSGGHVLMAAGQAFQFRGDLILECLPRNQVWEIEFSDVPVYALRAA